MADKKPLEGGKQDETKQQNFSENMRLQGGDNPGISLVTTPFDGSNYFTWSNGPLLYQIQREVSTVSQENKTLAAYFFKLQKLWDEMTSLNPVPVCSCGAGTKFAEKISFTQLIQFLMGLNDAYDHVRNQILLMDPLPSIGKAYYMILQVEKQREVNSRNLKLDKEEVMAVQTMDTRKHNAFKNPIKKRIATEKKQTYCTY
ncbi:UNVERIFIED_CONTAM: hypothetical protein Sindi_2703800 [Sesamum indicum]